MIQLLMKTILFFVLTQVIFCTFSAAQTREENRAKLDVIKAETSAKQQSGDYGDALKSAQTALRLTLDIYGGEHAEAARAYSDIGELYRLQRKYGASAENFEKAYMIYLRDPGKQRAFDIWHASDPWCGIDACREARTGRAILYPTSNECRDSIWKRNEGYTSSAQIVSELLHLYEATRQGRRSLSKAVFDRQHLP
jgi:tetratricopeptide (TPR) repeat protein